MPQHDNTSSSKGGLNIVTQVSQSSQISLFKVCLSGRIGVGKTSIFRCVSEHIGQSRDPLDEASIDHIRYTIPDFPSEISLYDTGGLDHANDSLSFTNYYHNAHCIIFVYDVTDMESLHYVAKEYDLLRENHQKESTLYVLFRNKVDEPSTRVSVTLENEADFLKSRPDLNHSIVCTVPCTTRNSNVVLTFFFDKIRDILQGQIPTGYQNRFKDLHSDNSRSCPCF